MKTKTVFLVNVAISEKKTQLFHKEGQNKITKSRKYYEIQN